MASYPHGVLAFRLNATQSGQLNVKVSLSRSQSVQSQTASVNRGAGGSSVTLNTNSGIALWSEARVVNSGGTRSVSSLLQRYTPLTP